MLFFLLSCPQRAEIAGFSLQFLLIFSRSHTNAYAPWDLPIWRRSKIAGFKNSPRRTIGCSIQSFFQISANRLTFPRQATNPHGIAFSIPRTGSCLVFATFLRGLPVFRVGKTLIGLLLMHVTSCVCVFGTTIKLHAVVYLALL